jgi:YVTN family beta-propeller protein
LVWNSQNNKIYCANYYSNNVAVIDGVNNSFIATIPVGYGPSAFVWNSTQNRVYVANNNSSSVSVIRDSIVSGFEETHQPLSADRFSIEVYPNPAKSFFIVRIPSSVTSQMLKMFDASGKVVKEIGECLRQPRNDRTGELRVSLKGIKPGIYFLQLNNEPETKKLVITK